MSPITKALRELSDRELLAFQKLNSLSATNSDLRIAQSGRWWLIKIGAEWKRRAQP